jgi:catechol 2,3-dioxygenase-like lactoylglutathione lyase family enzyme
MSIKLNHTIVHSRNQREASTFYAELFGLPAPRRFGPFFVVDLANEVSLDFLDEPDKILLQHYAFLVSEAEFDEIFGRIKARGLDHWADPGRSRKGEINHHDGGRGVYFMDPSGHLLEIITRPYGSGEKQSA